MKNKKVECPFCGDVFSENCEYVDVGVGMVQCDPNKCENCGASEKGHYPDSPDMEVKSGWWRPRESA